MSESSDNPIELLNAAVGAKAAITIVATDRADKPVAGQFVAPAKPGEPGVIWATPALDITQQVLASLNASAPKAAPAAPKPPASK